MQGGAKMAVRRARLQGRGCALPQMGDSSCHDFGRRWRRVDIHPHHSARGILTGEIRRALMKFVIATIFVLAAAVVAAWLVFDFRESVYCRRGSLDFKKGITEPVIKNFPVVQSVTNAEPQYHFGCGDGLTPAEQSLRYRSQLPPSRLYPAIVTHIVQCGYLPVAGSNMFPCFFTNGSKWLYVNALSETTNATRLDVELTFEK